MDIEPGGSQQSQNWFSRKYLDSKDIGVTLWRYEPNFRAQKAHSHKVQEEVYVVINGSGRILLNGKVETLKRWDIVRVAPKTVRAFEAGPDGLELIIAGGPKPPEGDGELAEANWPD
ncbi:MAG TPA: hypothetical protein VFP35_01705 [Candidatus Saccharimonadales bacterium]|nr:hypothetical protein [Candidatus Saccharimonadales bacterium]